MRLDACEEDSSEEIFGYLDPDGNGDGDDGDGWGDDGSQDDGDASDGDY